MFVVVEVNKLKATYTGDLPDRNDNYGVGRASNVSPQDTSAEMAAQTIGAYLSGKSSAASIGAYTG